MKRGGPLKRTKGLGRKTALRQTKGLEQHSPLQRTSGLKQTRKRVVDVVLAEAFFEAVLFEVDPKGQRHRRPCAICGAPAQDPHHILAKQHIYAVATRLGWGEETTQQWVWSPLNGLALCRRCHDSHEIASVRIPRSVIPMGTWAFVDALDASLGTQEMRSRVEAAYA